MIQTITDEELDFIETFYYSVALAECLFDNIDVLSHFDEEKFGEIRLAQYAMMSNEYMLDYNKDLSKKANFKLKEGAGNIWCFGGRRYGKTLIVEEVDILLNLLLCPNEWVGFSSFDASHIMGVLEPVALAMEKHPLLKLFCADVKRSPNFRISAKNGWLLESINMKVDGRNTGDAWYQKHFTRIFIEESSREPMESYEKRQDAVAEIGCVLKGSPVLMADFSTKKIEDVIIGDKIIAWDEKKKGFAISTVLNAFFSGIKDVVNISTESKNNNVWLTQDHEMLIKSPGDSAYRWSECIRCTTTNFSARVVPQINSIENYNWGSLLGFIASDGSIIEIAGSNGNIYKQYKVFQSEEVEYIEALLNKLSIEYSKDFEKKSPCGKKQLYTYRLMRAINPILEEKYDLLKTDKDTQFGFLAGFIIGDGYVNKKTGNFHISQSVKKVKQLKLLFGVLDSLKLPHTNINRYNKHNKRNNSYCDLYEISINRWTMPFYGEKCKKVEKWIKLITKSDKSRIYVPHEKLVLKGFKEAQEVYDLTTEHSNFIVNGLIVHNCVFRVAGMMDFTKYSPAGKIYYDSHYKNWLCNLPQYVSPTWDLKEKLATIRKHSGESSVTYKCFVSAEIAEEGICIAEGSQILLEDFNIKNIEDIEVGDRLIGFTEHAPRRFESSTVVNKRYTGKKEVINIKSGNNYLSLTPDHKVLAFSRKSYKWIEIETCLKRNYKILSLNVHFDNTLDYLWGVFIGIVESDGTKLYDKSRNNYTIYITQSLNCEFLAIEWLLNILNIKYSRYFIENKKNKDQSMYRYCIHRISNPQINSVYKKLLSDKNTDLGFLGGFIIGDGTITHDGSYGLCQSYKKNLDKCNLVENILSLYNISYCKTIRENIGMNEYRIGRLQLFPFIKDSYKVGNFRKSLFKSLLWELAHPVEELGREFKKVYDLETTTGTFIANNFLVHNCVFDIERVRLCYDNSRIIKQLEIAKKSFDSYKNILSIVERHKSATDIYICADIGESAPTEIVIFAKVDDKYRYEYNLTLYGLTDKEQYEIFAFLAEKLGTNIIAIDTGDGSIDKDEFVLFKKDNELLYSKAKDLKSHFDEGKSILAPTYNEGRLEWKPCELYSHHHAGKMMKIGISPSSGYVRVTPNHSMMVYENGDLRIKAAEELKINDWVVSPKLAYTNENKYFLNFLGNELELDEDMAYFLGWVCAEGSSRTACYQLSLGNEPGEAKMLSELYTKIFKKTSRPYVVTVENKNKYNVGRKLRGKNITSTENTYNIDLNGGREVVSFFEGLIGSGAHNKKIPCQILNSDNNIKLAFLNGLLGGDGTFRARKSTEWTIKVASEELVYGVGLLLKQMGIYSTFLAREDDGLKAYTVSWTDGQKVGHWEGIPYACIPMKNGKSRIHKKIYDLKEPTKKNISKEKINRIKEMLDYDFVFRKVSSIELYDYDDLVYDLMVADNNTFVAGMGDILIHNTGRSIFRRLEEVLPKENLIAYAGNKKINIGFQQDATGQVIFKEGLPLYVEEHMSEWSVKHLKELFYDQLLICPIDGKLEAQINSVVVISSGTRTVFSCIAKEDHLFDAFKIFSIAHWFINFNSSAPKAVKSFCKL